VIKNSIIYLSSSILNRAIPFLLLPIMTKYLTTEEYGTLSIYLVLLSFYGALIGMNIHMNISRNFFKVSKQEISINIGNIFLILGGSFSIYLLLTLVIVTYTGSLFSITQYWLLAIPIVSVMMMINNINLTILRNEGRAYIFGLFEVSNTVINLSVTILFLIFLEYGWHSQVVGMLIAYTIFFIVGIIYMHKRGYITFIVDKIKIKSILNISMPLIPHVIGGAIIVLSDRLFIEHMIGLDEVGIYSVGYTFGMILMLFTDAFIKAWSPWFYKSMENPKDTTKKTIVRYTYFYIAYIFMLAIIITIVSNYILPYVVDEKFYSAGQYILWISLGYAMFGVYQILFPYLVHTGKTLFLAYSTSTAAITNLILNYVLINYFGTIGAAYATAIAYFMMFLLLAIYAQKIYPMPWAFNER